MGVLRPFDGGPERGDTAARAVAPLDIAERELGLDLEAGVFGAPAIDTGLRGGRDTGGGLGLVAIKAKRLQGVIVTRGHTRSQLNY